MAEVLLAVSVEREWTRSLLAAVERVARSDRFGEHSLTSDPGRAEIILFLDSHQSPRDWRQVALRRHPFVRRFPDKVFVYDERDLPRDSLPGVYVGMPRRRFDEQRHRSFAYYFLPNDTRSSGSREPDLLFSFQGRRVGSVRDHVLSLTHRRALVEDTSGLDFFTFSSEAGTELRDAEARYREVMGRSKFVLCPRGAGTSSLRLFETLACGRVPVVISDEWVPPRGIAWHSCMLRIPEEDVESIPRRLEAVEPEWERMSREARRTYDEWFGPQVWFHRAVEHCLDLRRSGDVGLARQWNRADFWRSGARRYRSEAARLAHRASPGRRATAHSS